MSRKEHWEKVYATKSDQDVGWYQRIPETSLKLILKYTDSKDMAIVDAGGGNSHLSARLFDCGYTNLTILDISRNALIRSKNRFKTESKKIHFIETDILDFVFDKPFDMWHDRAVFHFLTDADEITRYAQVAYDNIIQGGYLILGSFSVTGPKSCSGLPITQYDQEKLNRVFHDQFDLVECFEDAHTTPSGNSQNFIWSVFKKN